MGDVLRLFEGPDKWIPMRLRSNARKRFKSKGGVDHHWPIQAFDDIGLVCHEQLARARRLLPAWGAVCQLSPVPQANLQLDARPAAPIRA